MRDIEQLMRATDPARAIVVDEIAVPSTRRAPERQRAVRQVVVFAAGVLSIVVLISGLLLLTPSAPVGGEGDYPYYSSAAELESAAEVIVLGTVVSEGSGSYEGIDYRVVSVEVQASAKGAAGSSIEVKLMRGSAEGDSNLRLGESYVLYLVTYGAIPASTLNPWQGAYEVVDGQPRAAEGNPVEVSPAVRAALGLR